MTGLRVAGHFLPGSQGPIFVLARQPTVAPAGCVLVLPAFGEEMNKCRRMVALVGEALAASGVATVVPDLFGTGDSGGDFADAGWAGWQSDVAATSNWCAQSLGPVTGVLAIRLGCALASSCLETGQLPAVSRTVLWQPLQDGERFLTQFLRIRTAASLMGDRKETVADLRARLGAGETLEVAGYRLTGAMASDLSQLAPPAVLPAGFGDVAWLELVRTADAELPPPAAMLVKNSQESGVAVRVQCVPGEPYWNSTETVVNPTIVSLTAAHFCARSAG